MAPAPRASASTTFTCEVDNCGKTFSRREYLARHHRSKHSKERPFQCQYCERGFSRSDLLKRHFQTCVEAKAQREREEAGGGDDAAQPAAAAGGQDTPMFDMPLGLPVPPASASEPIASTSQAVPHPDPHHPSHLFPTQTGLTTLGLGGFASGFGPSGSGSSDPANLPTHRTSFSESTTASPDFFTGSPASIASVSTAATSHVAGQSPESSLRDYTHPALAGTLPAVSSAQQQQPLPPPSLPALSQPALSSTSSDPSPLPSVFKPGVSNATLAPGLSGTGSFTQDEVLASEVLRDLMKSPMSSAAFRQAFGRSVPGDAPMSGGTAAADGAAGGAGGNPWHGAKAAAKATSTVGGGAANESTVLVDANSVAGTWGYFDASANGGTGSTDGALTPNTAAFLNSLASPLLAPVEVSNKLEESPAAQHLAEYFNKGGVGGITALDLGFPTEPSIFPDFLFAPPPMLHDDLDKRFYVPEQKFCLGYLYPWHVPPVQVLSGYARRAATSLLPALPVMHSASINMSQMPTHTAFALTVAGGAYEPAGQSFSNEMLVEKRVYLVRGFQAPEKNFDDRFASLQSLLLYQLLGLFHKDEQQRLLSQSFHSALIYMLRSLDLPTRIRNNPLPAAQSSWTGEELERQWKAWVEVETWRRVTFIVFLTDLENAIATNSSQHLALSDMDLDLPASDRLWNAKTAAEWQERSISTLAPAPMSFLAAVRALMAPGATGPDPFSEQGILLAELGRLSSFPLLILSRTLSFLEKKTEEALAERDPFKGLLGGLGVMHDREQENRDVLMRIRRGREVLRRLPGGIARGGGESWFNDVVPTAAAFNPDKASASPASSATHSTASPITPFDALDPLDLSSSIPSTTAKAPATLEELLAEFDPKPYEPFYGSGGATRTETYEEAQARLKRHGIKRLSEFQKEWPDLMPELRML
ncbi:hypothetical protein JCM8097_001141 [Rhodosporidiobolus ruineniae]